MHFLNDFVLFSTIVYLRADCLLFYQSIVNESGETIVDVKDLAPSIDSKGNYEGFETLVDRANVWLREQRNVTILNMQSLMVQEMRQGLLHAQCYFIVVLTRSSALAEKPRDAPYSLEICWRCCCCSVVLDPRALTAS